MSNQINSTIDAITAWYSEFENQNTNPKKLTDEEKSRLFTISGRASPDEMALNLAALAKTLWVAECSGELDDQDLRDATWSLFEFGHLVSECSKVSLDSADLLYLAENPKHKRTKREAQLASKNRKIDGILAVLAEYAKDARQNREDEELK